MDADRAGGDDAGTDMDRGTGAMPIPRPLFIVSLPDWPVYNKG